jgi:hypothetical protein
VDEKTLNMLEGLKADIEVLHDGQNHLEAGQKSLQTDVTAMKGEVDPKISHLVCFKHGQCSKSYSSTKFNEANAHRWQAATLQPPTKTHLVV